MKKFFLFSLLLLAHSINSSPIEKWSIERCQPYDLFSKSESEKEQTNSSFFPWFTGPFLVPSPITLPVKTPAFEPSVTVSCVYGSYNNNWSMERSTYPTWSVLYLGYWQMGLTQHFGLDVVWSAVSNYTKGISSTHFTDTAVRLGYQILHDKEELGNWTPNFRLIFEEIFPTGNYHKLNPDKFLLDATGQGSFQSGIYLVFEKGFSVKSNHPFNLFLAPGFFISSNFRVKGPNLYGGNHFTDGKVKPGNVFSVYFSGELRITKHVSFAFDSNYLQNLSGQFSGKQGLGEPVKVPQMVSFSVAPELEITVSDKFGFLFGTWETFAGQNTPSFAGAFLAVLLVF